MTRNLTLTILGIAVTLAMLVGFFATIAHVSAANLPIVPAQTTPANYTIDDYGPINLYSNNCGVWYTLSGLDSTHDYTFWLAYSDYTGKAGNVLASIELAGSTGQTIYIGPNCLLGPVNWKAPWDSFYVGPLMVFDEWGRVLGRHFVARPNGWEWTGDYSVSASYRQGIGVNINTESPDGDTGYFHDESAPYKTTVVIDTEDKTANWTLLHFRTDGSPDPNEYIEIRNVETGDELASFSIADLQDYNDSADAYTVLALSGTCPAFVDCDKAGESFVTLDNPLTVSADTGVYDYARKVDSTVLGVGESVLIVTDNRPTLDRPSEWALQVNPWPNVKAGTTLIVNVYARTETVWDAYIDQTLADGLQGEISSVDYAYSNFRRYTYSVSSSPTYLVPVTYTRKATALNYGQDVDDFRYELITAYNIVPLRPNMGGTPTISHTNIIPNVTKLPDELGWDSTGTQLAMYVLALIVAFGIAGVVSKGQIPAMFYVAVYELITIGVLLAGWFDMWAKIIVGVVAVAVFTLTVAFGKMGGRQGNEG